MTISAIWKQAWDKFKNANWITGVVLLVLGIILSLIPYVGVLISYILGICLSYYGLQVWRSESSVELSKVFPSVMAFLKIFLASILLAAIPGIIVLISAYDFIMDLMGIARAVQEAADDREIVLDGEPFA